MEIGPDKFEPAYQVAVKVFQGSLKPEEGAKSLHAQHGMNLNSARDFISNYKEMRAGKGFHRAMSGAAMEYFLTQTEKDFDREVLETALSALRKHITYYEGLTGGNSKTLRKVASSFENRLGFPVDYSEHSEVFQKRVNNSVAESSEKRKERLLKATGKPAKQRAVVTVYDRNPDVVAEVLERAQGICERCANPAPFVRKKDNTPYLEVHHIEMIANGGLDIVSNAQALCPNCHRELHFGC